MQSTEHKNTLLREEVETLEKRIAALSDENQNIKQRVEFLSGKNGELQQLIIDHASTIATLKDQAKLSYETLEHFRLSVQQ